MREEIKMMALDLAQAMLNRSVHHARIRRAELTTTETTE